MRARRLEGKTIKRIGQSRFEDSCGTTHWTLDYIEFTDGSFLRFITIEGLGDYGTAPVYPARRAEEARS